MSVFSRTASALRSLRISRPVRRATAATGLRLEALEVREVPAAFVKSTDLPRPWVVPLYETGMCAKPPTVSPKAEQLKAESGPHFAEPAEEEVVAVEGAHSAIDETSMSEAAPTPTPPAPAQPKPVLLMIANRDFYYQEYGDTRRALEAAGVNVMVAAATLTVCTPHPNSGQGASSGLVLPNITLAQADATSYSAIVFVGGWGASSYQYAFAGTYANSAYNGSTSTRDAVNRLVNDFVDQDKYVAAICHGVSVLAWARVDGASPISGRSVSTYAGTSPGYVLNGVQHPNDPDPLMSTMNGATVFPSRSIGHPFTAIDDVWVDGKVITAENWDSATIFGQTIAARVIAP